MWKSHLICLTRPLNMVLAIWANFGRLRAKISKIGWGTPILYWSTRLYLPIGIQNWPYFGWDILSHFLPWVKISGEKCVYGAVCAQHFVKNLNIFNFGLRFTWNFRLQVCTQVNCLLDYVFTSVKGQFLRHLNFLYLNRL